MRNEMLEGLIGTYFVTLTNSFENSRVITFEVIVLFLTISLRCCAVLDRTATAWLNRLLVWLELFEPAFGRASQRGALRRYVHGVLSDSRRKSMEAMWARVSDPGTYYYFVTLTNSFENSRVITFEVIVLFSRFRYAAAQCSIAQRPRG